MISHGFEIQAATDIELSGCRAYDNGGNGVFVPASLVPTQVLIRGGVFSGNSYAASGTYSGIYIDNNVANFTITDAMSQPNTFTLNTQAYGIVVSGTAHDHYVITGNQTWGNVTGGILDQGTGSNKTVANNI
jgi:hypothetical protein